jgi:hypothetical protein
VRSERFVNLFDERERRGDLGILRPAPAFVVGEDPSPMARSDPPLVVRIPARSEDRPALSRVGVVAVLGFALGIAWPKLLGARLGPDVPGGGKAATTSAPNEPGSAEPVASTAAAAPSADPEAAAPTNRQRALLRSLEVVRCRDKSGKKLEAGGEGGCKPLAASKWIEPKLSALAACPSVIGLEGEMELELELDFEKSSVRVDPGEKSAFPNSTIRGVLNCAAEELGDLDLAKIPREHPRTTLLAKLSFVPPGKAIEAAAPADAKPVGSADAPPADGLGSATVSWEKALLRDSPKDGKVVARVPQGSRVKLLEQRDEWYRVQKGDVEGWVYRQAIGK